MDQASPAAVATPDRGTVHTGDLPGSSWLVTGDAVAIDLRPARLGSRMIAGLVDLVIEVFAFGTLVGFATYALQPQDSAVAATISLVAYVAAMAGYPVVCETLGRGRTIGKIFLNLRVVRDDGGPIRFRHALTRGLIGTIVERPGVLLGLPAIVAMLVSRRSKRIGDLFAGTVVLHESVPVFSGITPTVPGPLTTWVTRLDLTGLDDDLADSVRDFLGRLHELSEDARERVGAGLTAEVMAVVTPLPPPGTPGWAYLSAVLAERTRRDYARLRARSRHHYYGQAALPGVPPAQYLPPAHLMAALPPPPPPPYPPPQYPPPQYPAGAVPPPGR
jgi:uncharacterized RDD family membrane protein YckC